MKKGELSIATHFALVRGFAPAPRGAITVSLFSPAGGWASMGMSTQTSAVPAAMKTIIAADFESPCLMRTEPGGNSIGWVRSARRIFCPDTQRAKTGMRSSTSIARSRWTCVCVKPTILLSRSFASCFRLRNVFLRSWTRTCTAASNASRDAASSASRSALTSAPLALMRPVAIVRECANDVMMNAQRVYVH